MIFVFCLAPRFDKGAEDVVGVDDCPAGKLSGSFLIRTDAFGLTSGVPELETACGTDRRLRTGHVML